MPPIPASASLSVTNSSIGQALTEILLGGDILPGATPSYQLCKAIYLYHPLGAKMAEAPVKLAQRKDREISVEVGPKGDLVKAFRDEWKKLGATKIIFNVATQARVYGIASVAMLSEQTRADQPIDPKTLWKQNLSFNVLDPLNTSGSLVTSQNPNSFFFQKHGDIVVNGETYHRSRAVTMMNEQPIYIAWTSSAFGYVGRSCYQRALYPLKSYIRSMITDEMIVRKAGVLVAKQQAPGSVIDRRMWGLFAHKRELAKEAETDNVLTIGLDESFETLNMQNLEGPFNLARNDIIKNIATSDDMPAKLLTQEAFVEGFGEGTEDAKAVAEYGESYRSELEPLYDWFDGIVQRRAWNPEFYETIQRRYPKEYGKVSYEDAFYQWKNAFEAKWPPLIQEPPSEAAELDDIKLKAAIAVVQVLSPELDPENRANLVDWLVDVLNTNERLFAGIKFMLDPDTLLESLESQPTEADKLEAQENAAPERPFSSHDSQARGSVHDLIASGVVRKLREAATAR